MAEYIDRKDLDFLNDFRIDSGKYVGLRLDDVFDELATADVIERSKIDKAIDEIINLRKHYPNEDYYDCKDEVLEILKRNIGE